MIHVNRGEKEHYWVSKEEAGFVCEETKDDTLQKIRQSKRMRLIEVKEITNLDIVTISRIERGIITDKRLIGIYVSAVLYGK